MKVAGMTYMHEEKLKNSVPRNKQTQKSMSGRITNQLSKIGKIGHDESEVWSTAKVHLLHRLRVIDRQCSKLEKGIFTRH